MKLIKTLLIILIAVASLTAQQQKFARVKIDLTHTDISEVAKLGLEADHGIYAPGKHLINDYSLAELVLLEANNIPFKRMIDDVISHYVRQNEADHNHAARPADKCSGVSTSVYDYETPANYEYGTMGGYLTYDQVLATLDEMAEMYPDLISVKTPIGDILSHEGRPIYSLKVSDNVNEEEGEPELLYTALHHAREPNSLSQMIFYIWYLLENYETDAEVKYLVDNTAMYFIPVINPDGYVYNETTNPEGGGLWRKNRRFNGEDSFGVDLNRNYGYEWGFDDQGSSTNPNNDTYRGTEGFSEPETEAVRQFCDDHQFKICLNYHSFGNLLIYPWGYSDSETPDHETFLALSSVMTQENDFFAGTGTETVGYTVNGNSDDWMYGETDTKPAIFSMTPEVGGQGDGFWPAIDRIDYLNKSCVLQNLVSAHLLLNYAEVKSTDESLLIATMEGILGLEIKKYGFGDGGFTLSLSAIGDNVSLVGNTTQILELSQLESQTINQEFILADNVADQEEIRIAVSLDNGEFVKLDTITKIFEADEFVPVLTDFGNMIDSWLVSGDWTESSNVFYSAPTGYADNLEGLYEANTISTMDLKEVVDLTEATAANISFFARWDVEARYDLVQIMASTDGENYTALCGKYTVVGSEFQDVGQPLYDGAQIDWVQEEIDLTDFLGETVSLRFRLLSDQAVEGEGFFFDDLTVNISNGDISRVTEINGLLTKTEVRPNPFSDALTTTYQLRSASRNVQVALTDALGNTVAVKNSSRLAAGKHEVLFPDLELNKGIYFMSLSVEGKVFSTQKVVKL